MKIRKKRSSKKNRTQVIREYLNSLPVSERSPTAAVAALRARGVKVTRSHVSVVKSAMGDEYSSANEELLLAKRFLDKVGGAAKAHSLISVVNSIIEG